MLTLASSVVAHAAFKYPLLPTIQLSKETPLTEVLDAFLSTSIFYTSLIATAISVVMAIINNHNLLYALFNKIRLTYKNGNFDVWQDTFYKHRRFWLNIRFQDGRSLIGWPQYYSPTGKPRELFVADATWWIPNSDGGMTSIDVTGAGVYISDFTKVVAIEVLDGVQLNGQPLSTETDNGGTS